MLSWLNTLITEKAISLFILDGVGDFSQGFTVGLKVWGGDSSAQTVMLAGKKATLPPAADLPELYEAWKIAYQNYVEIRDKSPTDNNSPATFALKERPKTTNTSGKIDEWETEKQRAYHACVEAEKTLLKRFNRWLESPNFQKVRERLKAYLFQSQTQANRILIESNNPDFKKMPWQKWDLLREVSLSEVGLSSPNFKIRNVSDKRKKLARILVILGKDANIQEEIQQLATDNIEIKIVTNLADLDEPLWNEAWDIIVFNGHSVTSEKGTQGRFQLNQDEWLSIGDIREHFNKAIERGLKLVIFNSCDGLGLAHQLGEGQQLYLPQIMVMRDLLPVPLAPVFLQYFFEEFIKGVSLYSALRATRDRLEFPTIKQEFPCASWLPVICQNPAHLPLTWNDLRGVESGINGYEDDNDDFFPQVQKQEQTQKSQENRSVALDLFISYAYEDTQLKNEFKKQLTILERQKLVAIYSYSYARNFLINKNYENIVKQSFFYQCRIILLLIIRYFLAVLSLSNR